LTYSGKDNILTGTALINFPFLDLLDLTVTIRIKSDCTPRVEV